MEIDDVFDTTVPQRAVMVTRTSTFLLPIAADAPLDDVRSLPDSHLLNDDNILCAETVTVDEAPADDVLLAMAGVWWPRQAMLDAASRLLPDGDGDLLGRIVDAADEIRARRSGAVA